MRWLATAPNFSNMTDSYGRKFPQAPILSLDSSPGQIADSINLNYFLTKCHTAIQTGHTVIYNDLVKAALIFDDNGRATFLDHK